MAAADGRMSGGSGSNSAGGNTFFSDNIINDNLSVSQNCAHASPSKTCCHQIPHHIMHEWSVPVSSQSPEGGPT